MTQRLFPCKYNLLPVVRAKFQLNNHSAGYLKQPIENALEMSFESRRWTCPLNPNLSAHQRLLVRLETFIELDISRKPTTHRDTGDCSVAVAMENKRPIPWSGSIEPPRTHKHPDILTKITHQMHGAMT